MRLARNSPSRDDAFEIVAGGHRYSAALAIKWQAIEKYWKNQIIEAGPNDRRD
jgi:ParB-like chromosome segregation protein Spo0J